MKVFVYPTMLVFIISILHSCSTNTVIKNNNISQYKRTLPSGKVGQVVKRKQFAYQHSNECKTSIWVSYEVSRESLVKNFERTEDFRKDPLILGMQATLKDYEHSGYDRGHLARAALFTSDRSDMSNTFLLSNIIPQNPYNNRHGSWRKIERLEYQNILERGKLYIISGPIYENNPKRIGPSKVCVPTYVFKVIYDLDNKREAIGFIVPNNIESKQINPLVFTVDEVEKITGLDFFHELSIEEQSLLESSVDLTSWNNANYEYKNLSYQKTHKKYDSDDSYLDDGYNCGQKIYWTPKKYCYAVKNNRKKRVKRICCVHFLK